jgi:hypothetical protein
LGALSPDQQGSGIFLNSLNFLIFPVAGPRQKQFNNSGDLGQVWHVAELQRINVYRYLGRVSSRLVFLIGGLFGMFLGNARFSAYAAGLVAAFALSVAGAARAEDPPQYPPHADVLKGYEKVISTADDKPSLFTIWTRDKDSQMYAELPKGFASQKYFIALTVSSGEEFAGLQAGDIYVYWRQYDNRLALITPNMQVRSTGDDES